MHDIRIRPALVTDIPALARHRAAMFLDMGKLTPDLFDTLVASTTAYLDHALRSGEYVGWVAETSAPEGGIIGGAGVQLRRILPRPVPSPSGFRLVEGREAIVLNVYTEPDHRRRGIARALMETILAWAREAPVDQLVLHASPDGRHLYEALGFEPSNEMRFTGSSTPRPPQAR